MYSSSFGLGSLSLFFHFSPLVLSVPKVGHTTAVSEFPLRKKHFVTRLVVVFTTGFGRNWTRALFGPGFACPNYEVGQNKSRK